MEFIPTGLNSSFRIEAYPEILVTDLDQTRSPPLPSILICATLDESETYNQYICLSIPHLIKALKDQIKVTLNTGIARKILIDIINYCLNKQYKLEKERKEEKAQAKIATSITVTEEEAQPKSNLCEPFPKMSLPQNLQPKVPPFDMSNVGGWLERCSRLFLPYCQRPQNVEVENFVPQNCVQKMFTDFLPDHALQFHLANLDNDWETYKKLMIDEFQIDNSVTAITDLMLSQAKKPGEDWRSYLYRVNAIADKSRTILTDEDRCRILVKLLPLRMASFLVEKNCTVKEFIKIVERLQSQSQFLEQIWDEKMGIGSASRQPVQAISPDASSSKIDKICALLEKLSVEKEQTDEEKKLDTLLQSISKLADRTTPANNDPETLTETVMKIVSSKFPQLSNGRGRGGRGRGNRGQGRGRPWGMRGGARGAPHFYYPSQNFGYMQYYPMQQQQQGQPLALQASGEQQQQPQQQAPQLRRCYSCNGIGHLSYTCPNRLDF